MPNPLTHQQTLEQQNNLLTCLQQPMHLAKIMGYDRLTHQFHAPIMLKIWDRHLRRPLIRAAVAEQVSAGLLPQVFLDECDKRIKARGKYYKNSGMCIARDHYKTTMMIVFCGMAILLWPEITIAHWHAVEAKAIECSMELGDHFFSNDEFRALRPAIMPSKRSKRFSTSTGFTVPPDSKRRKHIGGVYQKKERHATFFPKGAGAEVTGGHAVMGWLDDIVGQTTIDDSGMPKVRGWLGHTVSHVIRTDGGWLMSSYTPWDEDDVMTDWEKDKQGWDIHWSSCWTDDTKTTPVLYDLRWIKRKQRDPLCNFPYQMECNRVPDSERRWPHDWKGHCTTEFAMEGKGRIFVLSDPAPMGLSLRGDKDRVRGDTGKDWWAISVVRLRVRGDFQDSILLDGSASQTWTDSEGYDEACRLMKKWGTNMFFDEDYSGGQYFDTFWKACRRAGVMPFTEQDSKGRRLWPKYMDSYQKAAKNKRFQKTCDMATAGAVWIASKPGSTDQRVCPREFWEGDGDITGALTQAKKWIPRTKGESTLKKDDHFDSWARFTDRKLQDFAPRPQIRGPQAIGIGPNEIVLEEVSDHEPERTRYCGL